MFCRADVYRLDDSLPLFLKFMRSGPTNISNKTDQRKAGKGSISKIHRNRPIGHPIDFGHGCVPDEVGKPKEMRTMLSAEEIGYSARVLFGHKNMKFPNIVELH
jgi:hypothetical protein